MKSWPYFLAGTGLFLFCSFSLVRACAYAKDDRETLTCASICGSPYAEVIDPKYMRSKLCLCPAAGGDGPRGQHWTLAYLDGGVP